jgi:hypothetical protein
MLEAHKHLHPFLRTPCSVYTLSIVAVRGSAPSPLSQAAVSKQEEENQEEDDTEEKASEASQVADCKHL